MRLLYLAAIWGGLFVNADHNITIDDTNTNVIQYQPTACAEGNGEWQVESGAGLNGGSIRFCNVPGATVTFTFTGVAVYFLSPLWPYPIGMFASVDSSSSNYINVTDPNAMTVFNGLPTVSSHPVWSFTGLDNARHVVVLSGANSMNGYHDLNVDGFIYTAAGSSPGAPPPLSSSSSKQMGSTSAAPIPSPSPSEMGPTSTNPTSSSSSQMSSTTTQTPSSNSSIPNSLTMSSASAVLSLTPPSTSSQMNSTPTSSLSSAPSRSVLAPVLGGVLGALAVLVVALFLLRRRIFTRQSQPHQRDVFDVEPSSSTYTPKGRMRQLGHHSSYPQSGSSGSRATPASASSALLVRNQPRDQTSHVDFTHSEFGGTEPPPYEIITAQAIPV